MASRHLLIAQITSVGFTPPSPEPCQAWHDYRVTNAHHEEGGGECRRACECTTPRGRRCCVAGGRRELLYYIAHENTPVALVLHMPNFFEYKGELQTLIAFHTTYTYRVPVDYCEMAIICFLAIGTPTSKRAFERRAHIATKHVWMPRMVSDLHGG
jgi:hypothetical protein